MLHSLRVVVFGTVSARVFTAKAIPQEWRGGWLLKKYVKMSKAPPTVKLGPWDCDGSWVEQVLLSVRYTV